MYERIEERGDGGLLYIALAADGVPSETEFPHPLVVAGYDAEGVLVAISASGQIADKMLDIYALWRRCSTHDQDDLYSMLSKIDEHTIGDPY